MGKNDKGDKEKKKQPKLKHSKNKISLDASADSTERQPSLSELLQIAEKSNQLVDYFNVLRGVDQSLFPSHKLQESKKKKSISKRKKLSLGESDIVILQSALRLITNFRRSNLYQTWSSMFYDYMCTHTEQNKFVNFLQPKDISHIRTALRNYILFCEESSNPLFHPGTSTTKPLLASAISLLDYLKTHKTDPYSCLVGLQPSKDVIEACRESEEQGALSTTKKKQELLQMVLQWSQIEDPTKLQSSVREFAGELRGVQHIKPGSLVIAETAKDFHQYARFPGCEGNTVALYLDPNECDTVYTRIDKVFSLKPETVKRIREASIGELERLVHMRSDTLYQDLMRMVELRTFDHVKSLGIDMEIIKKANIDQCSISELQYLKSAHTKLHELCDNPPLVLTQELQKVLVGKIFEFRQTISDSEMFKPTLNSTYKQLESFQISALAVMHIHRYAGICDSGLDQLNLQKRELMNGERKDKISAWWLDKIDKAVVDFLSTLGYNHNAVPENYVEVPPEDMNAVKNNAKIISRLLNSSETNETGVKQLVTKMKEEIYPIIDTFLLDAKIVLSEQFEMDLTGQNFSLELIEEAYQKEKPNLNSKISEWIDDMIKDIRYLNEMRQLEDPEYAKAQQEVSLHIVPISGLVMGTFYRLENECNTVVELWEDSDDEPPSSQLKKSSVANIPPLSGSLRSAVVNGDFDEVLKVINANPTMVNCQDRNGWTLLHFSINHPELKLFDALLSFEEIDVNKEDNLGNTVLHYMARFPMKPEILKGMKRVIDQNGNVNATNNNLETPLHSTCECNQYETTVLLLEHNASVNVRNRDGKTPLQIAVYGQCSELIQSLLQWKADPMEVEVNLSQPEFKSSSNPQILSLLSTFKSKRQSRGGSLKLESSESHTGPLAQSDPVHLRQMSQNRSATVISPRKLTGDDRRNFVKSESCEVTSFQTSKRSEWSTSSSSQGKRTQISMGSNRNM